MNEPTARNLRKAGSVKEKSKEKHSEKMQKERALGDGGDSHGGVALCPAPRQPASWGQLWLWSLQALPHLQAELCVSPASPASAVQWWFGAHHFWPGWDTSKDGGCTSAP